MRTKNEVEVLQVRHTRFRLVRNMNIENLRARTPEGVRISYRNCLQDESHECTTNTVLFWKLKISGNQQVVHSI